MKCKIAAEIEPSEMKELCEEYGLHSIVDLFIPDEILDEIKTSDIVENVVRRYDFNVYNILEE